MSATALEPFDVCGALPDGVALLEASAGTGKTYAIAALATRFVAERGVPLDRVLVVTFTRAATGELRERVRARLADAERALARALAGDAPPVEPVLALLATGSREALATRHGRLVHALSSFDAATIDTTHGFCRQMLAELGVAGDVEPDAVFIEDVRDLVEDVVDDLWVRRWRRESPPMPFGRRQALDIARAVVDQPYAELAPPLPPPGADQGWAVRRRFAECVRYEVDRRKRRERLLTYDDLLTRLHDTLADDRRGGGARRRLRDRYDVVLVDEFQDTDPIQWEILRRAFAGGDTTLVLIGDPKQAIYAFRAADVYAYLRAAEAAGRRETLATCWRSDQGLLDAYDALFAGARLGHEQIVHRRVCAPAEHAAPRLAGAPDGAPLRMRIVRRDSGLVRLSHKGLAERDDAEAVVARDLADDAAALVASGAQVIDPGADGAERRRSLGPGHLAVLVRTQEQARLVRHALSAADVPAVFGGAGSVFREPAADEWRRLLRALEQPTSGTRAASAALTCFIGKTPAELATAGEDGLDDVHVRLHRWAGLLRDRGVATLYAAIGAQERLAARVLGEADGERRLTDLAHVAQVLHETASAQQLGVPALVAWLRNRIDEARADAATEHALRLDSDADAVRVLTVHGSKGLEFPVVYVPFLWQPSYVKRSDPPLYHDAANGERLTLDVGLNGPGSGAAKARARSEQRGEDLRLLYVALTRARHQAVVWWAASSQTREAPLTRLLFARDQDGNVADAADRMPDDDEVVDRLRALGDAGVAVDAVDAPAGGALSPALPNAEPLRRATFDRGLDTRFRRLSYSAIVAAAHEASVASEPEDHMLADEAEAGAAAPAAAVGEPLPLAAMPGGREVGDLVHRLLEATDLDASDLDAELAGRLAEARRRRDVDVGDPAVAVAGLAAALRTPLGALAGGRPLAGVARRDRLDEVTFELPLVGGDDPAGDLPLAAVADLLEARLPADDPLRPYAAALREPGLRRDLRGYLTGTLDLVLRVAGDDGPRFLVVDYKTDRLAAVDETPTTAHYRPGALAAAMRDRHYALQALLYVVAAHRYLRGRVLGYRPEAHLGGVLYLFLRGMTGPSGGGTGVFAWRPPPALVEDLSDLLDRGAPA